MTTQRSSILILCSAILYAGLACAQEIPEFYNRGGGKFLSAMPGELKEKDNALIAELLTFRLSAAVRTRLVLLSADIILRGAPASTSNYTDQALTKIDEVRKRSPLLSAFGGLSLGDFFWTRFQNTANFERAKPFYQEAITNAVLIPAYADKLVARILRSAVQPPWLKTPGVYGAFGNFFESKSLISASKTVSDKQLKTELSYYAAHSMIRESGPIEEVCKLFKEVADVQTELQPRSVFDLATYLGSERTCYDGESRESLLRRLKSKFPKSKYAEQATELLKTQKFESWTIDSRNARRAESIAIALHGPDGRKTRLEIKELGLILPEELNRRKVALSPWITESGNFLDYFLYPVKSFYSGFLGNGEFTPPNAPESGVYLVELTEQKEKLYLLVSDLVLLAREEGEFLKIQSVSLKSGSTLGDVEIEANWRSPAGLRSTRKVERYSTDAAGSLKIRRPKKGCRLTEECDSEELVLIAKKFRHLGFLGADYRGIKWPFSGDPEFWVVLSSSTAKPGEMISWNLLIRPDLAEKYAGSRSVSILHHTLGMQVQQQAGTVDKFGRAAGIVRLGRTWTPGDYRFEVRIVSRINGDFIQEMIPFTLTPP